MKRLKWFLLFFCVIAIANNILFAPPQTVTVTTTSGNWVSPDALRTYLLIVNNGPDTLYVSTTQQSGANGIPIPPGGNYEPFGAPANGIWMRTGVTPDQVVIVVGH